MFFGGHTSRQDTEHIRTCGLGTSKQNRKGKRTEETRTKISGRCGTRTKGLLHQQCEAQKKEQERTEVFEGIMTWHFLMSHKASHQSTKLREPSAG